MGKIPDVALLLKLAVYENKAALVRHQRQALLARSRYGVRSVSRNGLGTVRP